MRFMGSFGRRWRKHNPASEQVPVERKITFEDFSGGYDSSKFKDAVQQNFSPYAVDMEVDDKDRLQRGPGTTLVNTLDHVVTQLDVHASLDDSAELLLFAAPALGYKRDAGISWIAAGLPTGRRFTGVNFGGSYLFSSGVDSLYVRQAGASTVEVVPDGPPARSYGVIGDRVIAGGAIIDGRYEPLGVRWTGASGDYTEWTGIGSGFELLISDMTTGDRIVALRSIGLDLMAALLRKSIWIGARTTLVDEPVAWRPQVAGIGAVNEATCKTSRFGVFFLSDTGVYVFDGNAVNMISKEINADLLPLDMTQLDAYSASYNPLTQRYYLHTPVCTWVYDTSKSRWYRRSLIVQHSAVFAEQVHAPTWAEMTGSWGAETDTWAELSPGEGESRMIFLGERGTDQTIEEEDYASEHAFAVTMVPRWDFPMAEGAQLNQLFTIKGFLVRYINGGTLELYANDNEGQLEILIGQGFGTTSVEKLAYLSAVDTGLGLGTGVRITTGTLKIISVQVILLDRGPRIEQQPFYPREYYPDFGA